MKDILKDLNERKDIPHPWIRTANTVNVAITSHPKWSTYSTQSLSVSKLAFGHNRHIQNILPNSIRIYTLLKSTWDIFKDISYVRPQNNSYQIQEHWNHTKSFFWIKYHEARITRRKMENSWIHENETTLYWTMD